ncbi:hypothetical protein BC834DRAFT_1038349 [Gloeopeniophorella convolvens]|nr:hypothetical protein BC834DRAFT_1038349 [Gloeopeniophorella convolvens]
MSSTLPPKPDFEPLPSRPPQDRRPVYPRSPRRSSPPPRRPPALDSYQPDHRRYRDSRAPSRYDSSDWRTRDDRYDPRRHEPDSRRDYDYRRDFERERERERPPRDYDGARDGRSWDRDRGRDYDRRDYDRGRDREYYARGSPPRRRSRSRRRDDRSRSPPRRRSLSRDHRRRSPSPFPSRRPSPRRRSPDPRPGDARPPISLPPKPLAPSEPTPPPPLRHDSAADAPRPYRERSPPVSPRPLSASEARASPLPASSVSRDKGKGREALHPPAAGEGDVNMSDAAAPSRRSPLPVDQARKPSPQPAAAGSPMGYPLPAHPGLPAPPKWPRSPLSGLPSANANANATRAAPAPPATAAPAAAPTPTTPAFRLPPYTEKEIVKDSINREASFSRSALPHTRITDRPPRRTQIARLTSTNAAQKAACEPLVRAAERSRHELELGMLELYAAEERRKAAAAQVEEARAGTLGVGGVHVHDYAEP